VGHALGYVVVGLVFGPVAVLLYQLIVSPARGKHRRRRVLPSNRTTQPEKGSAMTTQQPEPRDDNGGPERVHPGNVEGDVVNGDKVEGDVVEGDEVDNDPNDPDDDDTDAPGHRREDDGE
jgi:hypothetical protein